MRSKKPSQDQRKKYLSFLLAICLLGNSIGGQVAFAASTLFDEYQSPILNNEVYKPILPSKTTTSITPSNIEVTAFDNVQLDSPLPNIFYQYETYVIKGRVTQNPNNATELFAFLNYTDTNNQESFINFGSPIVNNTFTIPLRFPQTGNYKLGIILGNNGKSKIREIHVDPLKAESKGTAKTTGIQNRIYLSYDEDKDTTSVTWKRTRDDWYKITFQQDEKTISYIVRQNTNTIPLKYSDFRLFKPGSATITLSTKTPGNTGTWTNGIKQKVQITYHGFRTIEKTDISISNKSSSILKTKSSIIIQGTALENLQGTALITRPNGTVEGSKISSSDIIQKGNIFTFNYNTKENGTYIIEINNEGGGAAINLPFYATTATPLIPDFQDMANDFSPLQRNVNLAKDRQSMLNMINAIRTGIGLSSVKLDANLNTLAQNHSVDMENRHFFGHINPSGEAPEDRRKKAHYASEVGENLANAQTLFSSMQGLLRSPIHRKNILNPVWTRVGIGIVKSSDGTLKITQEFSGDPLAEDSLITLKNNILTSFNNQRTSQGNKPLTESAALLQVANSWSQKLAKLDTFGLKTDDGSSLSQMVQAANIQSSTQMFIFSTNSVQDVASRIFTESEADNGSWQRIGIGLGATKLGELKITILLSK